jgi:hypothetical protein
MNVVDSLVVMPDQIYGCEKGVAIPVSELQMSLRSQEQFMGMYLAATTLTTRPVPGFSAHFSHTRRRPNWCLQHLYCPSHRRRRYIP